MTDLCSRLATVFLALAQWQLSAQAPTSALFLPYSAANSPSPSPSPSRLSPVLQLDVDNDGIPDLVQGGVGVAGYPNHVFSCYINRGNGALERHDYQEAPAPYPVLYNTVSAVGDVDGDGLADIFVSRYAIQSFAVVPLSGLIYLNRGNGSFVLVQNALPAIASLTRDAVFFDADSDGDLDLLVVDSQGVNRLFVNDGTGRFGDETSSRLPAPVCSGRRVFAFDVDRDGHVDILVANADVNMVPRLPSLYMNDGTGHFSYGMVNGLPGSAIDACVADLDGDGWTDVVILDRVPPQILQNRNGTLTSVGGSFPPGLSIFNWIEAADFDNDGRPDLASLGPAGHVLLQNVGGFTFVDASQRMPSGLFSNAEGPIFYDLDLDGDLDMVTWNGYYASTMRHVSPRNVPRIGSAYDLGVYAQANHMLLMGASIGVSSHRFPESGWLWLDQGSAAYLGNLYFTAFGGSTLSLPVPNLPWLTGLQLCVQALDVDVANGRAQFTNAPSLLIR